MRTSTHVHTHTRTHTHTHTHTQRNTEKEQNSTGFQKDLEGKAAGVHARTHSHTHTQSRNDRDTLEAIFSEAPQESGASVAEEMKTAGVEDINNKVKN